MTGWRCPKCGVQLLGAVCPNDGTTGRTVRAPRKRRQSAFLAMCQRKAARDAARPARDRRGPLWFFGVSW